MNQSVKMKCLRGWLVIPLIFPKVPPSSQTESLGFPSYPPAPLTLLMWVRIPLPAMNPAASWNPGMASCFRRNALASQSFAPGLWTSHGGAHLRTGFQDQLPVEASSICRLEVDKASMQLRCVPTVYRCIVVFFFFFHPEFFGSQFHVWLIFLQMCWSHCLVTVISCPAG